MDRREILEKTLWHIYETSDDSERNIWIWDNASTDDTPDFLGTMVGWPGVRVFRSKVDLGIAGPRKRMLQAIDTPYIFTLDDDMWMLNKGWASGVSRVLEGDLSTHQVALGTSPDIYSDYGISHTKLDRPFFRMPFILPGPKADTHSKSAQIVPRDCKIIEINGEFIVVPEEGSQLWFSCSGGAAAWRTSDILPLIHQAEQHPIADLRETWGFSLIKKNNTRESVIIGYGCLHPSPGPLWHMGRCEKYWEERCSFAEAIYGRSAETQRRWLEDTKKACGWGQELDNPVKVLPPLVLSSELPSELPKTQPAGTTVGTAVNVVILCGGRGMRLNEYTESIPKPMVEIGEMPILWHIMKTYSVAGFKRFILCLGYKGVKIKEFYVNFDRLNRDFTLREGNLEFHNNDSLDDWTITLADTGLETETGGRLLKIQKYISEPTFLMTYGDVLSDIWIPSLLSAHYNHGKHATMTCVKANTNFGTVEINSSIVKTYQEKPKLSTYINGGYFCLNKEVFEYIKVNEALEKETLQLLIADQQLGAYVHDGYWGCMDNFKDYANLNEMWARGEAPWRR